MVILKDIPCNMSLLLIKSVLKPYWWVRGGSWDIKGWKATEVFLLSVFSVRLCPVIHVQDVCAVSMCNNYYTAAVHMIQWQNGFIWDSHPVSISQSLSLLISHRGSWPCQSFQHGCTLLRLSLCVQLSVSPCRVPAQNHVGHVWVWDECRVLSKALSLIAGILQWCWNVFSLCLTVVSSFWTF